MRKVQTCVFLIFIKLEKSSKKFFSLLSSPNGNGYEQYSPLWKFQIKLFQGERRVFPTKWSFVILTTIDVLSRIVFYLDSKYSWNLSMLRLKTTMNWLSTLKYRKKRLVFSSSWPINWNEYQRKGFYSCDIIFFNVEWYPVRIPCDTLFFQD